MQYASVIIFLEVGYHLPALNFPISCITIFREWDMPVELLVPVIIFATGAILALKLGGMGIDMIVENSKK